MVKEEIWAKKETLKKQGFDSATINKRKEVAELVSYMLELQDTLDAEQPPAAKSVPAPQAPIDLLAESAPEFDFQSDRINKYLEETILMLRDDCGYAEEDIEEDPDVIEARERLLELKAVGWKVAKFEAKDTRTQKESKGARIKLGRKRRAGQLDSHFSNFCEDMTEKSGKEKRKFKKELITRKKSEVLRTRRERSRTAEGELAGEFAPKCADEEASQEPDVDHIDDDDDDDGAFDGGSGGGSRSLNAEGSAAGAEVARIER